MDQCQINGATLQLKISSDRKYLLPRNKCSLQSYSMRSLVFCSNIWNIVKIYLVTRVWSVWQCLHSQSDRPSDCRIARVAKKEQIALNYHLCCWEYSSPRASANLSYKKREVKVRLFDPANLRYCWIGLETEKWTWHRHSLTGTKR